MICMGTGYNVIETLDEGSIITTGKRVFGVIVLQDEEILVDMSCPALSDEIVESETLALGLPPLYQISSWSPSDVRLQSIP